MTGTNDRRPRFEGAEPIVIVKDVAPRVRVHHFRKQAAPAYLDRRSTGMCRNIKTLANFEPPATDDKIRASSLQFVRKLSGTSKPSRANEAAFNQAVDEVTAAAHRLVHSLRDRKASWRERV